MYHGKKGCVLLVLPTPKYLSITAHDITNPEDINHSSHFYENFKYRKNGEQFPREDSLTFFNLDIQPCKNNAIALYFNMFYCVYSWS
jgi:hypothetical protein